ncbi:MAG: DUF763 domain-containing protein, partial [Candidatus Caldarchaeum sp.]|nr:DUF763 domain-containing protein [Candidatus Caldarchaeum sp.]MDW8436005.1 DUF763 domain-containing protein [Candidatus Caldarchaeum sp.]
MFRSGVKDLRGWGRKTADFQYNQSRRIINEVVHTFINFYGPDELVSGFAEPYFTDFIIVTAGLDEMSADSTIYMGSILKECITPKEGAAVLGGRFVTRFRIPQELPTVAKLFGFSDKRVEHLLYCSRMVAKTDSVALQDGFDLYFHMMILSSSGLWTVIQQSINPYTLAVRRYHWFSDRVKSFVDEPHTGIVSEERKDRVLDMTAKESRESRAASLEILSRDVAKLQRIHMFSRIPNQTTLDEEGLKIADFLRPLPAERINWALMYRLEREPPKDYEQLLAVKYVGRGIVRLLAFGVYVLHGIKPSLADPAISASEYSQRFDESHLLWRLQQVVESVKSSNLS